MLRKLWSWLTRHNPMKWVADIPDTPLEQRKGSFVVSRKTVSVASLGILAAMAVFMFATPTAAYAGYVYEGDEWNDDKKPWTWIQDVSFYNGAIKNSSWAKYSLNGQVIEAPNGVGTLGKAGCMIHSMTEILLKAGVREYGYTPKNFCDDAKKGGYSYGITGGGAGYGGSLATMAKALGKDNLVYVGQKPGLSIQQVTDGVKAGSQYVLQLQNGNSFGGMHWIATDYVDDKGELHVLDSGTAYNFGNKGASIAKNVSMVGVTFSDAHEYKMKSGTWKTIDSKGKSSASTAAKKDDSSSKSTNSKPSSDKPVTEDELTGMPERNSYADTGSNKGAGGGGLGIPKYDDVSKGDKESLASLQEQVEMNDQQALNKAIRIGVAVIGFIIFAYCCIALPMAFMFDRANTVLEFSALSAITLGRMKTLPSGMTLEDVKSDKDHSKYIDPKRLVWRVLFGFVLASVVLSGVYWDWALAAWWWLTDHMKMAGEWLTS